MKCFSLICWLGCVLCLGCTKVETLPVPVPIEKLNTVTLQAILPEDSTVKSLETGFFRGYRSLPLAQERGADSPAFSIAIEADWEGIVLDSVAEGA